MDSPFTWPGCLGNPIASTLSSSLHAPHSKLWESQWSSSVLSEGLRIWGDDPLPPFDFSSQANYRAVLFARQIITASFLASYIFRLEEGTSLPVAVQEPPSEYTHQAFPMILSPCSPLHSDAPPVWSPDPATD